MGAHREECLKIEIGYHYEDRRGRLVGPLENNRDPATRETHPFYTKVANAHPRRYTQDGYFYDSKQASHADLMRRTTPARHEAERKLEISQKKVPVYAPC